MYSTLTRFGLLLVKFMRLKVNTLLILCSGLVFECSKKDPAPPLCYLTATNSVSPLSTYASELTYDDQHRVVKVKSTSDGLVVRISTYDYNSNGKLISISHDDGNLSTFAYDNKGRMVVSTFYYQAATLTTIGSFTWTYSATNQPIMSVSELVDCSACGSTTYFTYPNSTTLNYTTVSKVSANGETITSSYEYDDHPNPLRVMLYAVDWTENNITKITITTNTGVETWANSYTYNERGYPLVRTGSDGGTSTYTYNCP